MKNLSVFEIGNIYYKKNNYQEEEYLGILMSNLFSTTLWKGEKEIVDFYLLKGVLETLFSKLNLKVDVQPLKDRIGEMHPHMSASLYLGNEYIGYFGSLHPQFMQENDLDNIFVAEIKLSSILDKPETEIRYQEISKVPSVERDIAIIVPKETPVGKILDTISKLDNTLLSNVDVFDVYTGDKIAKDEKSIAIKLEFSADTTLTEEIINKKVNKILKEMNSKFGAILRS
jgi:phenylalanyl-tRNA synthetase beta chain